MAYATKELPQEHGTGRAGDRHGCRPNLSILAAAVALGLTVVVCCQGERKTEKSDSEMVHVLDSTTSADGLQICYEVWGNKGRPLVFVHGWGGDRSYWHHQVAELSRDYRVVAIDLGGHGHSALGREDWTMQAYGGDVAAVVEQLGLRKVILIGHSMGGAVNIEAARRLGRRVTALIGVDTYQDLEHRFTKKQIETLLVSFRDAFEESTKHFVRSLFPESGDWTLAEDVATDMALTSPEVGVSSLENLWGYDAVSALKDVRVPIHCINSAMAETNVESNRRHVRTFEVELMTGVGHFPHLEDPAGFNERLRKVINQL